jgi:hypothetical protein
LKQDRRGLRGPTVDRDALPPATGARENRHGVSRNPEAIREKADELLVGSSVHRRCVDPDLEGITVEAYHFRACGARLHVHREDDRLASGSATGWTCGITGSGIHGIRLVLR